MSNRTQIAIIVLVTAIISIVVCTIYFKVTTKCTIEPAASTISNSDKDEDTFILKQKCSPYLKIAEEDLKQSQKDGWGENAYINGVYFSRKKATCVIKTSSPVDSKVGFYVLYSYDDALTGDTLKNIPDPSKLIDILNAADSQSLRKLVIDSEAGVEMFEKDLDLVK
jgi:hypothetical protein